MITSTGKIKPELIIHNSATLNRKEVDTTLLILRISAT